MMVVMAVCMFLGALKVLSFTPSAYLIAIIETAIYGYLLVVLHSYAGSIKQCPNLEMKYDPPMIKSEASSESPVVKIDNSSNTLDLIDHVPGNSVRKSLPNNFAPSLARSSAPSYIT